MSEILPFQVFFFGLVATITPMNLFLASIQVDNPVTEFS